MEVKARASVRIEASIGGPAAKLHFAIGLEPDSILDFGISRRCQAGRRL